MSNSINPKLPMAKIYKKFNEEDKTWNNFFYNNLKSNYYTEKDYPNLNKIILGSDKYLDFLENKINKLKPDLIFTNIDNNKIHELIGKYKVIKKIIWISYKLNEEKILSLKHNYDYLLSDNNYILNLAKKNNFISFKMLISNEPMSIFKKDNYLKRNEKIYFSGSLGNDFKNRLEYLLYVKENFELKVRIRNLMERYKILNFLNFILLKVLPTFANYLFKKKLLPITNKLKFINEDEVFGKVMLDELRNHKFCINIHSDFDRNNTINARVFEALACGCLLFTDENKFMRKIFKHKQHLIYFKSKNDLKKKINYYKKNNKAACKIAKKGNQFFIKKHQSKIRLNDFKRILKKIG
tara:strand:+ start:174 stop:1232 length:1059 start_codon:yes stop_codon:yes gene_type:complete